MKWFKAIRLTSKPSIRTEDHIICIPYSYLHRSHKIKAASLFGLRPDIHLFGNHEDQDIICIVVLRPIEESILTPITDAIFEDDNVEGYYRLVPTQRAAELLSKVPDITNIDISVTDLNEYTPSYRLDAVLYYSYTTRFKYSIYLNIKRARKVVEIDYINDPFLLSTNCGPLSQLWMNVANLWLGAIEGINQDDAKIVRQQLLSYKFLYRDTLYYQRWKVPNN
ncbi:MAG: hypothetical protein QXQ68_05860 [Candidatus Nitrosocaldaceae archaeon]